jgi:hypothetical protein
VDGEKSDEETEAGPRPGLYGVANPHSPVTPERRGGAQGLVTDQATVVPPSNPLAKIVDEPPQKTIA